MLKALDLIAPPRVVAKQEQRAATPKPKDGVLFVPGEDDQLNFVRQMMGAAFYICTQTPAELEAMVRIMATNEDALAILIDELDMAGGALHMHAGEVAYALDRLKGTARKIINSTPTSVGG